MPRAKQPPRKFSAHEVAELMRPPAAERLPEVEAPKPVEAPPVKLPETGEEALERLGDSVKHAGDPGDAPAPRPPEKRLVVTEYGGKVSSFQTGSDPVYVHIEWSERTTETPWVATRVDSRFGLSSVETLVLEDVEPEV